MNIEIGYGNHEELYEQLESGKIDLALSDQRRAFSDTFENPLLKTVEAYA